MIIGFYSQFYFIISAARAAKPGCKRGPCRRTYGVCPSGTFVYFVETSKRGDAMHKRGLCRHAVSVRLTVCVSVTFVVHVKTNKDIFKILSPPGSHTIMVFPCQTA